MSNQVLLDTDIVVDYLRGHPEAIGYIDSLPAKPAASVVVVTELYGGVREGDERVRLERLLDSTDILPLDIDMAIDGGLLRRQYGPSHGIGLDDALIAATSRRTGLRLASRNRKHFPMLPDLIVPYTTP